MASPRKEAELHLSTITKGSDEELDPFCQPCNKEGIRLPANGYCLDCKEHLCDNCITHHTTPSPCKNHRLLDKNNMPQTMSAVAAKPNNAQSSEWAISCSRHKQEAIMFCHDHDRLLCTVCISLEHQTCTVDHIPDISWKTIDGKEIKDTLEHMSVLITKYEELKEDLKKLTTESNASLTKALEGLRQIRTVMDKKLDAMEEEVHDIVKFFQKENATKLATTEAACDDLNKTLVASTELLKQLNSSKQADKLFVELKNAEEMIKDYGDNVIEMQTSIDVKEYIFQPNQMLMSSLAETFGKLVEKTQQTLFGRAGYTAKQRPISSMYNMCVETGSDYKTSWITNMTLLSTGCLMVTDYQNASVKMVDTNRGFVSSALRLQSSPWDITRLEKKKMAVTVPGEQKLQFISVSDTKLKLKQALDVHGHCFGVSYCDGKFAVTFENPSKLQILDMKGKILRTVAKTHDGENIFERPNHVVSTDQEIYVSDSYKNIVHKLNWQGEVLGRCLFTTRPYGITLSEKGFVFVCQRSTNSITKMTGDCYKTEEVIRDIKSPLAACWCPEKQLLYISSYSLNPNPDNALTVVKL